MRITVHLDTFNRISPSAYAVLWLDKEARKWSREGHRGIDLPSWGQLADEGRSTLILGAEGTHPLCVLDGLDMSVREGPFEGEAGDAIWCQAPAEASIPGHWYVQFVDPEASHPERGLFAGPDLS